MNNNVTTREDIQNLLNKASGLDNEKGDARLKKIVHRIISDLYLAIEELNITETEFWNGLHYLQNAAPEYGLIAPGLGFDRFLDELMDAADEGAGLSDGTPRAIEGPLYVEGAPVSDGFAEMCDDESGEPMVLSGVVRDIEDNPISGAIVDIWHASAEGGYSHFDPSLKPFTFRRRIKTGKDGSYKAKSIVPCGYAVPPGGATDILMTNLGRHGHRPAHIHFFVEASGYKHLTTQINLAGDEYIYDDFAYATRDELIVEIEKEDGISNVNFDFTLVKAINSSQEKKAKRPRAKG